MLAIPSMVLAADPSSDWIQSVRIEGLNRLSLNADISTLNFKTRVGQHYKQSDIVLDVNSLYLTGYFQSVVERTDRLPNGLAIVYQVVENPVIRDIVITGNISYSTDYLAAQMQSKRGAVLNLKQIESDKKTLDNLYALNGFSLFAVSGIALQNNQTLLVRVNEGLISKISFSGLKNIDEFVLRRELRSTTGTAVNQKIIQSDRSRLLRLGYFSEVGIPTLENTDKGINMGFPVVEKKVNLVDVGLETDQEEFVGYVQGRLNHVIQKTDVVSVKTQVGLVNRQLRARSYSARYFQPWLLNLWPVQGALDVWTDDQVDLGGSQVGNRHGWDAVLRFPLSGDDWSLSTTLKNELVLPNTISSFRVASLAARVMYESDAHRDNEEAGSYGFVEYQRAFNLLGFAPDGLQYSKYSAQWANFFPLSPSTVFAVNSNIAYYDTKTPNDSAFNIMAFRIGGSNSLRGYPEGGLGGLKDILFNLEYRFDLSSNFEGLVFSDFGNVFDSTHPIDLRQLKSSYGIGMRFQTPVGAIRSDLSWGQHFVVHLNIGQLF